MKDKVLIATRDALSALAGREDLAGAQAYADTDVLSALAAIARQPPALVALDRLFAATPRGMALVERLRRDPALSGCELKLVTPDAARDETVERALDEAGAVPPLDDQGTRIAPRFAMRDDVDVTLDGRPARLIDLSQGGAQLVTAVAVKPQQRVRIALKTPGTRLRMSATVQWASFEMPVDGPRYRAGVRFADAEPATLSTVIEAYRQ